MKVGMLTTWQTRCGIAAYTGALVAALRERPGLDVEVVPISPGLQDEPHYREQAAKLNGCDRVHVQHEYSFWGGYVPGKNRFHTIRRLITRPVVLTAHTTTPLERLIVPPQVAGAQTVGGKARLAYRRARMRTLLPILLRIQAYRDWIELSPFTSANRVIVHTREGLETLAARGVARERLNLLPAGIPRPLPVPDGAAAFRARFGLDGKRLIALFGYVTPFKGNELALQALAGLPPDVYLVIAGGARTPEEEPYVAALRQRIADAGLAGRVTITGFLDDDEVAGALTASEVVLVPHTQATGSYSVTAPLSYARPILASDLACFRDIAEASSAVRLFPSGDAAALQRELASLLPDANARADLSCRAAAYAESHSWSAVAAETEAIYRSVQ